MFFELRLEGVLGSSDALGHEASRRRRPEGEPYGNAHARFMRFRDGPVVEVTAFFDSIAFDEFRDEVTPAD